ncbi:hypothetical protein N7467_012330 [Penicillium canescens]|nr:hypothetical protein N7467_012330 [Penicillium canescens]
MKFSLLANLLLLGAATATNNAGQGGWKNGPTASGETDPNLTTGCDYYVNNVQQGDTCEMVEDYFDITGEQFENWNPELKTSSECKMVPGFSYCVSGPAGAASSAVPTATPGGTMTVNGTAAPYQTGIAKSCTKYYLVENGDTCYTIQDKYLDFTLAQFYGWNPAIKTGCKGLVVGDYVCVGGTSSPSSTSSATSSAFPTQSGVASQCNQWHFVSGNDTCSSILAEYDLTQAQFYKWNPSTGRECGNLWLKTNVCVGVPGFTPSPTTSAPAATGTGSVPSPVQSGIASNCTKYYKVADGDYCAAVEEKYNISAADFNKWNPAVGSSCGDLEKGVYVCVAV